MSKKIIIILFAVMLLAMPNQAQAAWYNDVWNFITSPIVAIFSIGGGSANNFGLDDGAGYWVYIRLEDRPGLTAGDDAGRSKRGDVVAILPDSPQFRPSETEKEEYLIIKASDLSKEDIQNYLEPWETKDTEGKVTESIAYRKNKIDIDTLNIPIKKGLYNKKIDKQVLKNKISLKDSKDLARYEKNRFNYLTFQRPLDKLVDSIIPKAFAAGTVVSTINKTGEDYNTLTLWEDAKDGDLVTAQTIQEADAYNDDGTLTDSVWIDGSTTNADYYMKVTVPVGERHNGKEGTGFVQTTTSYPYVLRDNFTVVEWVEIANPGFEIYCDASSLVIRNIIAHDTGPTIINGASGSLTLSNSIFYDIASATGVQAVGGLSGDNTAYKVYNTTIIKSSTFSDNAVGGFRYLICQNCIAMNFGQNSGWQDFLNLGAGSGNNMSSDASGDDVGSGNLISKVAANNFVTVASDSTADYHLKAGADAIDTGTDLGTTGGVNFDIDNYDRDAGGVVWDIGADERVATTITRYVNPSSTGGDGTTADLTGAHAAYASLSTWDAAERQDLTAGGGYVMMVHAAGTTADTTAVALVEWTTSATNYIEIIGDNTTGIFDTSKYRMNVQDATNGMLNIYTNYIRVFNLQFLNTDVNTDNIKGIGISIVADGDVRIGYNIFKGNNLDDWYDSGIYVTGQGGISIYNNIIYDFGAAHTNAGIYMNLVNGTDVINVYNNTISNSSPGIDRTDGSVTITNNIVQGGTTNYTGTFSAATDNIASDTTSPNNEWDSKDVKFVNETAGNENLHLDSSDTSGAIDGGTSDPGTGLFSDDIDGIARTGTWDIGADEYVGGAPGGNATTEPTIKIKAADLKIKAANIKIK